MPIILVVLLLVLVLGIWLTVSLVGLIVTLLVATLIGWLADKIVPGTIPYGWLGAMLAGLVGSWIGGIILGDAGPDIGGISLLPALVGAVLMAFLADWFGKTRSDSEVENSRGDRRRLK